MEKPPARVPPPLPPRAIPRMPPPPLAGLRGGAAQAAPAPPPPQPFAQAASQAPPGSTRAMILQAGAALRLRDEQLRARVQYYNAELKTNAELDAITDQVVAELRALASAQAGTRPQGEVEIELIQNLRELLEKLFSKKRSGFLTRKLEEVQRRITQLFFNSELYARLAEDGRELPAATWPEQALYFALKQHEIDILAELESMPVSEPAVRDRAIEKLQSFQRQLCNEFLSKTTPELERLLAIYREVLTHFFLEVFPKNLGEFCWEVVRESRVAHDHDLGYKITAEKFHGFRAVFDRKFLEHLVLNVQEPITRRASQSTEQFRDATLLFVQDPRIHTEICGAINDALYDYLHGEGYLDLPPDWRRLLMR
ncbi:hypothetical protein [Sandaracinus amylolyticus]|nr:hypothetical protein [Sandaracinus amylolyticus]